MESSFKKSSKFIRRGGQSSKKTPSYFVLNTSYILKVSFIAFLLGISFALTSCSDQENEGESQEKGAEQSSSDKQAFYIETKSVSEFPREITITKTGILEGASSISLNAQASGQVSAIYVKEGDRVKKGQALIKVADTVASYGLSVGQASTSYRAAQLSYEQSKVNLDKAVFDAQTAFDKAHADLQDTKKNTSEQVAQAQRTSENTNLEQNILKAKLDLENLERSNEETLNSYENTLANEKTKLDFFLLNTIDTSDQLLGYTDQYEHANDDFEDELGARNYAAVLQSEQALRELMTSKTNFDAIKLAGSLEDRVAKLQQMYDQAADLLTKMEQVLIFSESSDDFTTTTIAGHRTTIDGLQTTHQANTAGLVVFLNQTQTFLRTYEQNFESQKQAFDLLVDSLVTGGGNTDSALTQAHISASQQVRSAQTVLDTARSNLENAKKTRDVTLRQLANQIQAARISLAQASVQAGRLNITSPIDGTIGAILVDVGEEVGPGKPAATLSSRDTQFTVNVSQGVAGSLEPGQEIRVVYKSEDIAGTITSVSPVADQSLNYMVKIKVDTSVDFLGDFIEAHIPVTSEFMVLPLEHVRIISQSQGQVWSYQDGQVLQKNVILGSIWGDVVEIVSGLNQEDFVIISDMTNYNPNDFSIETKE